MVSKGPPVSQTTIIPEVGTGGTQVPVLVDVKQPVDEEGEKIPLKIQYTYPLNEQNQLVPLYVTFRKEINFDSGEPIDNKTQIEYQKYNGETEIPLQVSLKTGIDSATGEPFQNKVQIDYPFNDYGNIPVHVTLRQEIDEVTLEPIPNKVQIQYEKNMLEEDIPLKMNIEYKKDNNNEDIPIKVDAQVTSHWIWNDGQGDMEIPNPKRKYLQYVNKVNNYDITGIAGMKPGTTEQNGNIYINIGAWRSQWGLQGLLDTYDLALGITNFRIRSVTLYGASELTTGDKATMPTFEGLGIQLQYVDTDNLQIFPGENVAGSTYRLNDGFKLKVRPHERLYTKQFQAWSTSYTMPNSICFMYETDIESNLRDSWLGNTEYDKQITTNIQKKCAKNEIRLPYNCLWPQLKITLGTDRVQFGSSTVVLYRYAGVNASRSQTAINSLVSNYVSSDTINISAVIYFDFDVYLRSM